MDLTAEQLLSIAKHYWRSDRYQHITQEQGPEGYRLEERWDEELQKVDRWHAFLTDLKQALPDFTIGDGTATPDACFRCVAYPVKGRPLPPFDWVVVGCISILAPIYMVYGIEFERAGKVRLAETPVPLVVEWKEPPETTLFHALFSNQPESVP